MRLNRINKSKAFFYMMLIALVCFELINFDTTRYALETFYLGQAFYGIPWAALFALAACLVDFGGLARMFTPERGRKEPAGIWFAIGGWLVAATLNAWLTWWATISVMSNHQIGNEILGRSDLLAFVPVAVAMMIWLIRVSLILTVTGAGERLLHSPSTRFNVEQLLPTN